jgi:hypothetical protein
MRQLLIALMLTLGLCVPADAAALLNVTVTNAVALTPAQVFQLRSGPGVAGLNIQLQGTFTYGSGGTSADAYVQTSLDGGTTWIDVANFHFLLASARFTYNLSSLTPVTTEYTPTDGSIAANTAKDGVIGNLLRVKWVTVGTYAGGTVLRVDAIGTGITLQ